MESVSAIFRVESIETDWRPPFGRNSTSYEVIVEKGDCFDSIAGNGGEAVFKILNFDSGRVEVKYSNLFTMKNYKHQREKSIWLGKGEEETFTYLWGDRGITKKLKLKEIIEDDDNELQASDSS